MEETRYLSRLAHTGLMTASTGAFPWDWEAVTAISSALLVLGLVLSVLTFAYQRRRDRQADEEQHERDRKAQVEQRERDRAAAEEAIRLQADAARRDLATKIMVDAYHVLIDAPGSRDDTFLEKIQNPLSMLQLVMEDDELGLIRNVIKAQITAINAGSTADMGPTLYALRKRIRENLGIKETDQKFEYLRTWNPRTRSLPALVGLWLTLMAELAGDGSQERTMQQLKDTARLVELMGWRREREIVGAVAEDWTSADRVRREQLADELGDWIRGTQQILDTDVPGGWWRHRQDRKASPDQDRESDQSVVTDK